jgi:CBS domain-containing protein
MGRLIAQVMIANPITLSRASSVVEAARVMRQSNIGAVIVLDEEGQVCGILTDRDIVCRAVANGPDLTGIQVGDICSRHVTTLSPLSTVEVARRVMQEKEIRRIPIVEDGKPVGIVSLSNLTVNEIMPRGWLGDVNAIPPD